MMDYIIIWKKSKFDIDYTYIENQFKLEIIGLRHVNIQNGDIIEVYVLTDEDLLTDECDGPRFSKEDINSRIQIIILTKTTLTTHTSLEEDIGYTNLRLHTTKTL